MPLFDECCVLIPAATLEDFPTDLSDYDARSLLAAWTVLWHPRLLAENEQIPVWHRADGPPDPIGSRLIAVPTCSLAQLPKGYETQAGKTPECRWISGGSRAEMLAALELGDHRPIQGEHRCARVEDFFAAGFAALQIQVMTRRLRYTSNLDEIHLQNRLVAAAKAFLDGAAEDAIGGLHDVFDCLAEERDHYFSSDPHLIDLTLTSKSTIAPLLETMQGTEQETNDAESKDEDGQGAALPTPSNILIDCDVAEAIAARDDEPANRLHRAISDGEIGWAGGGPAVDVCLDAMTFAEAESVLSDAHLRTKQAIGSAPSVYGRFSGATPSDMTRVLVKLGYCGMIPLDFANGTGHGDEAKVIIQSAGAELEALTAKPIDASSDASFLSIGARLGEAIDSGEIATALLAHWPGQACDSFGDLQRVASWSLSLGRFWKLDDYFRDGEHPYHHAAAQAASPGAARLLESLVEQNTSDPISSLATEFRQAVNHQQQAVLVGMTSLVTGNPSVEGEAAINFAEALGSTVTSGSAKTTADSGMKASLLINPHAVGCRESVTSSAPPASAKHVFASSTEGGETTTTVDIPACGFVVVPDGKAAPGQGNSLGKTIRGMLFGGPKLIALPGRLKNEFMDVTISSESGAISAVYSGGSRGNRFSMRLIHRRQTGADAKKRGKEMEDDSLMHCSSLRVVSSSAAEGCLEASGEIRDAENNSTRATFNLRYTLCRGSRVIKVEGELRPQQPLDGRPWNNYIAARVAVVTEASAFRPLLRDKVHRVSSRNIVAPLGVLIDEAERQTLVASNGRAFHRRVGDRFLDTLLMVPGESNEPFTLFYGFDVPNPVALSRTLIAPPVTVPITAAANATPIGWILHAAPKDILITHLAVDRRRDGKLAAIMRVIQTRSQSCKASIRFFRDVDCALLLGGHIDDPLNQPLPQQEETKNDAGELLKSDGDQVSLSIPSHGVADVLVVFVD